MSEDPSGRATYRTVRLATVALAVLLAVSVLTERVAAGCWQTSISAYYWTAVQPVFVAAVSAVGVALVVNKGSTYVEDVVLNYAGFFAFGVAMVPTPRGTLCGGHGLPLDLDPTALVRNAVFAVLVTGVLAETVQVVLDRRAHRTGPVWVRPAGWLVIAGFVVWYARWPEQFARHGHIVSAVTMFAAIIVVVLLNGFGARRCSSGPGYARGYDAIALAMAATLAAAALLAVGGRDGGHVVIVVESLLILEFVAFWLVQTVELWDVRSRAELPAPPAPGPVRLPADGSAAPRPRR